MSRNPPFGGSAGVHRPALMRQVNERRIRMNPFDKFVNEFLNDPLSNPVLVRDLADIALLRQTDAPVTVLTLVTAGGWLTYES